MLTEIATIYTDGSCHTQHCMGAWVSIIFFKEEKMVLSGTEFNTTHNRMELLAVIKALKYIQNDVAPRLIKIITDSQYVTGLQAREAKFIEKQYKTNKGTAISNADLVKELLEFITTLPVEFIKIKAHQKKTTVENYNIEADILSRNMVRQMVKQASLLSNNK